MPAKSKVHYSGDYKRRARLVRQAAQVNPSTRCWRCGRTQAEHKRRWQAGHVIDGEVSGLLLAECEQCNTSAGASAGNRKRVEPHSERW